MWVIHRHTTIIYENMLILITLDLKAGSKRTLQAFLAFLISLNPVNVSEVASGGDLDLERDLEVHSRRED